MNSLVASGNIDKAAIFNAEGTSVWASSKGFEVCQPYIGHDFGGHGLGMRMHSRRADLGSAGLALQYHANAWRQIEPAEIKEVVSSYSDKSTVKKVQSEGFYIAGSRYVTIKAEDRSLYGMKV